MDSRKVDIQGLCPLNSVLAQIAPTMGALKPERLIQVVKDCVCVNPTMFTELPCSEYVIKLASCMLTCAISRNIGQQTHCAIGS